MTKNSKALYSKAKKFSPSAIYLLLAFTVTPYEGRAITSGWLDAPAQPSNWSNSAQWNNGIPNAIDDIAVFDSTISSGTNNPDNISVDAPYATIGEIDFNTLGGPSQVYSLNAGGGTLIFNSSSLTPTISVGGVDNHLIGAPMQITAGQTLNISTIGSSSALTTFGLISETGSSGSLQKSGPGILVLSGTATYTGGTNITDGTLRFGAANALPTTTLVNLNGPTAVLDLNNIASNTIGNLTSGFTGAQVLLGANAGNTLLVGDGTNQNYFGLISGGGSIVKQGTGTLTLFNTSNYLSYGGTTINQGTIAVQLPTMLGSGDLSFGTPNGALQVTNPSFGTYTPAIHIANLATGTLETTTSNITATFSGIIDGLGALNIDGPGTIYLTGANIYSGGTTVTNGTLQGNTTSLHGNITNNANVIFNQTSNGTYAGTISGTGSVSMTDLTAPAVLTFTGPNSYTGGTSIIGQGTLALSGAGNIVGNLLFNNTVLNTPVIFDISQITPATSVTVGDLITTTNCDAQINLGSKNLIFGTSTTPLYFYGGFLDGGIGGGTGGSITKQGSGTVVLYGNTISPANNYTGGTTILGGTLAIQNTGVLGGTLANPGNVTLTDTGFSSTLDITSLSYAPFLIGDLNGDPNTFIITGTSNLSVGTSNPSSYGGRISGVGSLTKTGSGTLTLTGPNTYTGGTNVNLGTLAISGNGSLYNFGAVNLNYVTAGTTFDISGATSNQTIGFLNGASQSSVVLGTNTLTLQANGLSIYDGSISGNNASSAIILQNGQYLILSGSSLNYATTLVQSGTLEVSGTLTNPQGVLVSPPSTLFGAGTIIGDVLVEGTLAPGFHFVGTSMNIDGNVTFGDPGGNGTLSVVIDPSGASTQLNVTGNVTIDPLNSTLFVSANSGTYTSSMSWPVLLTTGTINNQFATVTSDHPLLLLSATYNPTSLVLHLQATGFKDFTSVITQGNPNAVAGCFDQSSASSGSDFDDIITYLRTQSVDFMYTAFNQMQPTAFKGLAVSQQNIFLEVENALSHRFIGFFPTACEREEKRERPTVWAETFGSTQTQNKKTVAPRSPEPSYTTNTWGVLLGVDGIFSRNFALGACTGYSRGIYSMHDNAGSGDVDSFYVGPYFKFGHEGEDITPYFDASILGELNWYGTNRHINFGTVNRTARASHKGLGILFHAGGGAWIKVGKFDISPFVNFDLISNRESSYTESGADSLNLHVESSSYQFNQVEGGILARTCTRFKYGVIIPKVGFSVISENRGLGKKYEATLEGSNSCEFSAEGYYPNLTLFVPMAEIKGMFMDERLTASLYYQGKFGDDFSQNELGLQFGWTF